MIDFNYMKKIETQIYQYLKERGWDNLAPANIAKSISIEAAELLEIFQWTNNSLEETKKDTQKMAEIKKELADVLIYAFDMAVLLEIDTQKIIEEKLEQVKKKYPAVLMRKNAKAQSGSGASSEYLKIKNDYRRKGKS